MNLTGDKEPAATKKPDTLCHGCIEQIQGYLGRLPHLVEALRTALKRPLGSSLGGGRVSGSKEPPAPYDVNVDAEIVAVLEAVFRAGGWKVQIRDLVSRPVEPFDVWRKGAMLRNFPLSGVERALDLRRIHNRVDQMVGLTRVWMRRQARCPECDLRTLGMWSGDDTIRCTNSDCAAIVSLNDYESLCVAQGREKN